MAVPMGLRVCTTEAPMEARTAARIAAPRVRRTAGPTGLRVRTTAVPMVAQTVVPMAGLMVAQTADARR
jgi:hypothetical protein